MDYQKRQRILGILLMIVGVSGIVTILAIAATPAREQPVLGSNPLLAELTPIQAPMTSYEYDLLIEMPGKAIAEGHRLEEVTLP